MLQEIVQLKGKLLEYQNNQTEILNGQIKDFELAMLNADIERLKEEYNHQKQIKEYKHSIKKNTNELAKYKELEKDMQSTNDFLTDQINNLNKQIFELSNKENDFESDSSVKKPVNKRLNELSLNNSSVLNNSNEKDFNRLSSIDMNSKYKSNLAENDESLTKTPTKQLIDPSNQMTPSSTVRKQKQCAQQ